MTGRRGGHGRPPFVGKALTAAGLFRSWSMAHADGALEKYYKLTPAGFQTVEGIDALLPPKAFFAEISPALFE